MSVPPDTNDSPRASRNHWESLYACDFFAVETLGMFGTVRIMVFFVIELRTRAVHIAGMRASPDGAWMLQIARNLLDPVDQTVVDTPGTTQ